MCREDSDSEAFRWRKSNGKSFGLCGAFLYIRAHEESEKLDDAWRIGHELVVYTSSPIRAALIAFWGRNVEERMADQVL